MEFESSTPSRASVLSKLLATSPFAVMCRFNSTRPSSPPPPPLDSDLGRLDLKGRSKEIRPVRLCSLALGFTRNPSRPDPYPRHEITEFVTRVLPTRGTHVDRYDNAITMQRTGTALNVGQNGAFAPGQALEQSRDCCSLLPRFEKN